MAPEAVRFSAGFGFVLDSKFFIHKAFCGLQGNLADLLMLSNYRPDEFILLQVSDKNTDLPILTP